MEENKRKKILFGILIIVIIGGGIWLFKAFKTKPRSAIPTLPSQGEAAAQVTAPSLAEQISSPNLKTELLADPRFRELVIYGTPVEVGEIGRENPFLPFSDQESPDNEAETEWG